ncbi:RteC domain-containing protein [Cellulophaga lytica]|uniref:RteC domain-containing protein n=1 Tax=Cellulophaga lytica TaxID=979 RepID=UPI0032E3F596
MNWNEVYFELESSLNEAEILDSDIQELSNPIILICKRTLVKLNKSVVNYGFKTELEEINFFKKIKSFPLSKLIYYKEVRSIEISFPKAGRSSQLKYIRRHIKRVNKFYARNEESTQYLARTLVL